MGGVEDEFLARDLGEFVKFGRVGVFHEYALLAAYPHVSQSGLQQNSVCYIDEGEDDKLYVYWLVDQSLFVFKNWPNSGFPYWFPRITDSGIPWLSFVKDAPLKNVTIDDGANEIAPWLSGGDIDCSSELPKDIMSLVMESLNHAKDYANFRGVCKMWREIAQPICWKPDFRSSTSTFKFPWLMTFDQDKDSWSFLDPTCNMRYYYNNKELSGCRVQYSKDGWLLVTKETRTIFFYEPFSKTKINIVDIPEGFSSSDGMSFSCCPTSPDWIILIQQCSQPDLFDSASLSSGDEDWIVGKIDFTDLTWNFICSSSSPVFHNRKFYSLGRDGLSLLTLSIDLQDADESLTCIFRPHVDNNSGSSNDKLAVSSDYGSAWYLVSCEDELYRVVIGSLGRFIRVYKLILDDDPESEYIDWDEVKSFGDFATFVSESSSFATRVVENAHQNSINSPLLAENCCLSYKLEKSEFKSFDGDFIDHGIYGRKELFGATWIQPKVVRAYR